MCLKMFVSCFALFWCFALFLAGGAFAQIVTSTNALVDFGRFDFAASHNGVIQLGTDGNVNVSGFGIAARNNGNAGRVQITSPDTGTLELRCAVSGLLVDPSATDLTISNIEVAVNTGVVFGSGLACGGALLADPVVALLDMDSLGDPDILIGGQVIVPGTITLPPDQGYVTTGTGTPIRLSIVVQ